jgi:hypothetical protein
MYPVQLHHWTVLPSVGGSLSALRTGWIKSKQVCPLKMLNCANIDAKKDGLILFAQSYKPIRLSFQFANDSIRATPYRVVSSLQA